MSLFTSLRRNHLLRLRTQTPTASAGLPTMDTVLPTKRTLRNLEDGTVVASDPGLAAEKATRTYDEGVIT